jgi:hypothetical protein
MYVNGKTISVETIPGMEVEGMNSSMINCKNFCKCHSITPHSITIKKLLFLEGNKLAVGMQGILKNIFSFLFTLDMKKILENKK